MFFSLLFFLLFFFLIFSLKWWGREQLPSGFHHLFLSLLSQKSPVSVAQATETFTTAGNIFLASLRLAYYLSFIVYCRFGQDFYYECYDTRSRNRYYFDDELVRRLGKRHSDCRFLTSCFSYRQNCLVINHYHSRS